MRGVAKMLEYKQKRNNGRTPFAGVYTVVCVCRGVCEAVFTLLIYVSFASAISTIFFVSTFHCSFVRSRSCSRLAVALAYRPQVVVENAWQSGTRASSPAFHACFRAEVCTPVNEFLSGYISR